jgi:hypothetical protein
MFDGSFKNLIYVWEGEDDRWTATEAEMADIQRRSNVTNSATASDGEMLEAFHSAAPTLRPDVFQSGMEDAETQAPPPGAVAPPTQVPTAVVPNQLPPTHPPAVLPAPSLPTSGDSAPPQITWVVQGVVDVGKTYSVHGDDVVHVDIHLPGKRKRATTYDAKDLDAALTAEHTEYTDAMSTLRETFLHPKLESLLAEIRVNHDSMLKPANSHRRMDEVIQLRDQLDNLAKCKAAAT